MPEDEAAETLGRHLDLVARSIAARRRQTFPWVALLVPVLDRVAALDQEHQGRFDRHEAAPRPRQLRARRGPEEPWQADWTQPVTPTAGQAATAHKDGRLLPADVRASLRGLAGDGVDRLRVHDDSQADAVARAHGADAVTIGVDVFFRGGRYAPDELRGRALIAHEAAHVPASTESTQESGSLNEGLAHGENHARLVERAALGAFGEDAGAGGPKGNPPRTNGRDVWSGSTTHSASSWRGGAPAPSGVSSAGDVPTPPSAAARSTAPSGPPAAAAAGARRADADRPLPTPAAGVDVAALREDIVSDLMRRLRVESERGG